MLLEEAKELALQLMKQHGLESWRFKFDNAKSRFGSCMFNTKFITLSKHLVLLNEYIIVRNVILHEIAHALVGLRNGHNLVWKQKALEIGCDGERSFSKEKVKLVPGKLIANCPNCGEEYSRFKKPLKKSSCGKCSDGKFNENYRLQFKPQNIKL